MKRNREKLLVLMEILLALRDGPMIPNRLCQACNLQYARMTETLGQLEERGLVTHDVKEGHDVYILTGEGLKVSMNYQWINAMVMGDLPKPKKMRVSDEASKGK